MLLVTQNDGCVFGKLSWCEYTVVYSHITELPGTVLPLILTVNEKIEMAGYKPSNNSQLSRMAYAVPTAVREWVPYLSHLIVHTLSI